MADWAAVTEDLEHVEVRPVPGKRQGLVATSPIKAGTVIIRERPVASFVAPLSKQFSPGEPNFLLAKAMMTRPDADRVPEALLDTYMPGRDTEHPIFKDRADILDTDAERLLQASTPLSEDAGSTKATAAGTASSACTRAKQLKETRLLLAIIHLNSFSLRPESYKNLASYGFYLRTAMCNHSCVPNACHYLDTLARPNAASIIVRAIRDIEPGEEVCISYLELMDTTQGRQEDLQRLYYFKCTCPRCERHGGSDDTAPSSAHAAQQEHGNGEGSERGRQQRQEQQQQVEAKGENTDVGAVKDGGVAGKGTGSGLSETATIASFRQTLQRANDLEKEGRRDPAASAWEQCVLLAEAVYPPNWPTLATMCKHAYTAAKAADRPELVLQRWRYKFETSRRICRGPHCAQCGALMPEARFCARCCAVTYCSVSCQRLHWKKVHKRECRPKDQPQQETTK